MKWTPEKVKSLRQKLGWATADLARRLAIKVEEIQAWETGAKPVSREGNQQLTQLAHNVKKMADKIKTQPIADSVMREKGLEQTTQEDCLNHIDPLDQN